MTSAPLKPIRYRFGPFELDPEAASLSRNGIRVKLQDLPYRLLLMLVEKPGQVIHREEVRERLWAENTFVEFDNSLGVAIRKVRESLNDSAEAPRYVETIPRRGYRFIAPVTLEGATELDGVRAVSPDQPAAAATTLTRFRPARWAAAGLALLLLAAAVYQVRSIFTRSSAAARAVSGSPPVHVRRSLAILGFRNLPGRPEDNWLSAAFCEMLNTELAAGGELRLLSGEDVARAKSELPLTDEDTLAKSTLRRLRVDPGADVVVLGSYTVLTANGTHHIRLDLRLQDTASGDTIAEESVTGNEEGLFGLVSETSARLRQRLGVGSLPPSDTVAARALLPSNQRAVRFYTEGRARSWAFDFMGARDLLLKAVAADPTYPLAHAALSDAWNRLGYSAEAKAEAQRAREFSEHLPQEERLLIEGEYRDAIEDYPHAVEAYQSLFNLFPDNLEYGLLLASAQRWVNPADSLRTLDILYHLPPPVGEDPRIDLGEASAWINNDYAKAHAAVERAITKGTAQGSHLLVARAYAILCQQGSSGGASTAEIIAACENGRQSAAAAGDRDNEARTTSDFAALYFFRGDLAQAEAMWREAIPEFREVGDIEGVAATGNNLGDVFFYEGNLGEAKRFLQQAIPNYQVIGDKDGVARVLNDLGDLSRQRGDLDAASNMYRQAKATAQEIEDKSAIGYVLNGLGDVYLDRGDLVAARNSYEQALALRTQTGEKQYAAETQVALAQLSIEEGHGADAEIMLRHCRDQFHSDQNADDELNATVVLMRSLLAQEKHGNAEKELKAAEPLAAKSQNRLTRIQFDLARARIRFTSDQPDSSRPKLDQILRESRRHGFVRVELDVRLALAELAKKAGDRASAKEQLDSLEKIARAKGFGLIAHKAASDNL